MKRITLAILLGLSTCGAPVHAQDWGYQSWGNEDGYPEQLYSRELTESDPVGPLGVIVHFNALTSDPDSQELVVETEYGDFVFTLDNTTNNDCVPACPDTVELLSAPQGYTVAPFMLTTPENDSKVMYIYETLGS